MPDDKPEPLVSQFKLEFPDVRTRDDFEAEFKAWLKQWSRQVAIYRMLAADAGKKQSKPSDDLVDKSPHHYDGSEAGLLTIGATEIVLSDGTSISTEGIYVDLCSWF